MKIGKLYFMRDKPVCSIVYFSGTGCTKLAAEKLAEGLLPYAEKVTLSSIHKDIKQLEETDLLVLLFPIHAFNAPGPVYEWIEKQPMVKGTRAAVISVSGGGEVFPNRACGKSTIRRLKKRGYSVFYEKMLAMPTNILIETPPPAAELLLAILPKKTEELAKEIVSGIQRKVSAGIADRALSWLGEAEKAGAKWSGKRIKAGESCSGCGLCEKNCPVGNIKLTDGKPAFSNKCALCMKCIYSCPKKALKYPLFQKAVLSDGPCLEFASEKVPDVESALLSIKGIAWIGVRKYIKENRKLLG